MHSDLPGVGSGVQVASCLGLISTAYHVHSDLPGVGSHSYAEIASCYRQEVEES